MVSKKILSSDKGGEGGCDGWENVATVYDYVCVCVCVCVWQLLSSITMFLSSDIPLYHSLFVFFCSCSDPLSMLCHFLSIRWFCPILC